MTYFTRYAVFYAPRSGRFADRMADWLGWDIAAGAARVQPDLPGLPCAPADLTEAPRRYGFHGTIRAPFRPLCDEAALIAALDDCAAGLAPLACDGLSICDLHGFLALVPDQGHDAIRTLHEAVMRVTDPLRAPLSPPEIARRNPDRLSPRQRESLHLWGYPFVMDEFRFHLTLTGQLPGHHVAPVAASLSAHLSEVLPQPFRIEDLCLVAEDQSGQFHLRHRAVLTG